MPRRLRALVVALATLPLLAVEGGFVCVPPTVPCPDATAESGMEDHAGMTIGQMSDNDADTDPAPLPWTPDCSVAMPCGPAVLVIAAPVAQRGADAPAVRPAFSVSTPESWTWPPTPPPPRA